MLKLLKKALQVGEATVEYPFKPVEVAPGFRGKPEYNFDRCIACGACATACPPNAITMEYDLKQGTKTWNIFYGRCIFCGRCEEVCPTGAIALTTEFELAVASKEDLYYRAEVQLRKCSCCGEYFAPSRELEYVMSTLEQSGLPEGDRQGWRQLLGKCPQCRRRQAAVSVAEATGSRDRVQGGGQ